ncbi:MAG: hypothetical protein R2751_19125 [Bacteroidales bacterium]
MKHFFLWIPAFLLAALFSCERMSADVKGDVNLYLIESFETLDASGAISTDNLELETRALIAYKDLTQYDSGSCEFTITHQARDILDDMEFPVNGVPFAVLAGKEIIYTGYFWPSYSSASCQWVVIDPFMSSGSYKLRVQLGYPGQFEENTIPDYRNHPRILEIFERDGKLKH